MGEKHLTSTLAQFATVCSSNTVWCIEICWCYWCKL